MLDGRDSNPDCRDQTYDRDPAEGRDAFGDGRQVVEELRPPPGLPVTLDVQDPVGGRLEQVGQLRVWRRLPGVGGGCQEVPLGLEGGLHEDGLLEDLTPDVP